MSYDRNSYMHIIDPSVSNSFAMPDGATRITLSTIEGVAAGNVQTIVNLREKTAVKKSNAGAVTAVAQNASGIFTPIFTIEGQFAVATGRLQFKPTVSTTTLPVGSSVKAVFSGIKGKAIRYVEVGSGGTFDLGYTSQSDLSASTATAGQILALGDYSAINETIGSEFLVTGAAGATTKTLAGNLPYPIIGKNFIKKGSLVVQVAPNIKDSGFAGNASKNGAPIILPVTAVNSSSSAGSLTVSDPDGVLKDGTIHADLYAQNGFAGTFPEQSAYGVDSFGRKTVVVNAASVVGTKAEVIIDVDNMLEDFEA